MRTSRRLLNSNAKKANVELMASIDKQLCNEHAEEMRLLSEQSMAFKAKIAARKKELVMKNAKEKENAKRQKELEHKHDCEQQKSSDESNIELSNNDDDDDTTDGIDLQIARRRENHPEEYDSNGDLRDETPTPGGPGGDGGTRTGPNGTRMVTMPDDDDT